MQLGHTSVPATHFCCISCGNTADPLKERAFRCAKCNNLFDVVTDYSQVHIPPGNRMRHVFDSRSTPARNAMHRSGVWRFIELIWPELDPTQIVTLGEGIVPIVPAGNHLREWIGGNIDIHVIMEGQDTSGSFKDMGMTALMTLAKLAGVSSLTCASTGDTSAALAAYAAAAGLPCAVLLPIKYVTPGQVTQVVYYGGRVIGVQGDFDDCMRIQNDLVARFGAYPGNSLNPMRIAGHMATSFLLAQYFGWMLPDWIVAPVGNGSNTSSIGLGMRRLVELGLVDRSARILGCQTEQANPLARSWDIDQETWKGRYAPMKASETIATAAQIGNPVSFEKVIREVTLSRGAMQTATEAGIREGMSVCIRDGLPVCPQTGIALDGLRQAVQAGLIEPGSQVAIVSTATTLKFSNVFADQVRRSVEEVPPDTEVVARMLRL